MSHSGFQLCHPNITFSRRDKTLDAGQYSFQLWSLLQRIVSSIAIVALSPLFLFLFILVKCTSPGPFLFKQARPGFKGRVFEVYKIRTMKMGSEKHTELGVQLSDPKITAIGRVLRDLKLDELPQLWNIAKGEMAIVGPRPIPCSLNDELSQKILGFEQRYLVRPGLTSIGQICIKDNALDEKLVSDWKTRFEGELHYINNQSIAYDLILVMMTSFFVLKKLLNRTSSSSELELSAIETRCLSIPISNLNYAQITSQVVDWAKTKQHRAIGVCNVHSVTSSSWQADLRKSLLSMDLNTADGMPLVWLQQCLGVKNATRVYGPTLMLKVLKAAEEESLRVAFYGGHPEILPILVRNLKAAYSNLKIVEAISPEFRPLTKEEDDAYIQRLVNAEADIVFVGIGCPKQEKWMMNHRDQVPATLIGVGAAFDFHAGVVPQAPSWMQRIGLEWAYRLYQEPQRLWVRYLTTNPVFVFRAALQVFLNLTKIRSGYSQTRNNFPYQISNNNLQEV